MNYDENNLEIKRLNKIIEEKDKKINDLTKELNSLKMTNNKNMIYSNIITGCEHFKTINVFFKCNICQEFYPCYICHNKIQNHDFDYCDINKCRFCNKIYNDTLLLCPGCNSKKSKV